LWFAQFPLLRVEALVEEAKSRPLDPLAQAVLRSLKQNTPLPTALLDPHLMLQACRELADFGLVRHSPGKNSTEFWELTEEGRRAAAAGQFLGHERCRRLFSFVASGPGGSSQFIPIGPTPFPLPLLGGDFPFRPDTLTACLCQPREWKIRNQFPLEVEAFIIGRSDRPVDWKEVILVRVELLSLTLVEVGLTAGGGALHGYAVQPDTWLLRHEARVLGLPAAPWPEPLNLFTVDPPLEAWREAWRGWCQPRGVPSVEAADCRLEFTENQLRVHAPPALIERLRATRSDALKGEAWLLAGTGPSRAAAMVVLSEGKQ
jgi:hypothetical protein